MDESILSAYLFGAIHDGTFNKKHKTFRITQANQKQLVSIKNCLVKLGYKSWIYKEGKDRKVYALETTAKIFKSKFNPVKCTEEEKISYTRGYFDAEGGIPKNFSARFYIQIAQKNKKELTELKKILEELNIHCGKIHIPSAKVDPEYYRFYILKRSHKDFAEIVGSWHPRKSKILKLRVKIQSMPGGDIRSNMNKVSVRERADGIPPFQGEKIIG